MPELVAQGPENEHTWRKAIPDGRTITLGRKDKCEWASEWDNQISRLHAHLEWRHGKLVVRREPGSVNPIYFQGRTIKENEEFEMGVGENFVIGRTTFLLEDAEFTPSADLPNPVEELTCSVAELRDLPYADAEDRVACLAKLPALIRFSPSEQDFERRVLEVVLSGMPRAEAAGAVWMNPRGSSDQDLKVSTVLDREGSAKPRFKPSRRLVFEAIRRRRQVVMHTWTGNQDEEEATASGFDWAICAPLPDEPVPGWAVYVVGQFTQAQLLSGETPQDLQKGDLKFAQLVADIFGALRQVRDLQKRLSILQSILSPKVLTALARQNIEEVLRPRETEVTVLFCDLRGSCRIAEEGEQNLQETCTRVSEALGIMTRNILDKDGVIGDFQGDAAMGFWGWPHAMEDQIEMAARAALAIRKEFLQVGQKPGHPLSDFACGIGIAHGPAIAGRLGTMDQCKVSVFGPVVNLASRLESMTKFWKVPILLDEESGKRLLAIGENSSLGLSSTMRIRRLARIQPYGMQKTFMLHELLPPKVEQGAMSEFDHRDYEAGLDHFTTGAWDLARDLLDRLPYDGPAQLLKDCMAHHRWKVPKDWNGLVAMDAK